MQLTLRQVAELFNVSENTVTRWLQEENLPVHKVKAQYRFDRAELLEWAAVTQRVISPEIYAMDNGDMVQQVSLADAVRQGGVATSVPGVNRKEVLEQIINSLPIDGSVDRETLLELVLAREDVGSTEVGKGIAVPHPRYPMIIPGCAALVRICYLDHPLPPNGSGAPIDVMFLSICPTVHIHLQMLAKITNMLSSVDFLRLLAARADAETLIKAIEIREAASRSLAAESN